MLKSLLAFQTINLILIACYQQSPTFMEQGSVVVVSTTQTGPIQLNTNIIISSFSGPRKIVSISGIDYNSNQIDFQVFDDFTSATTLTLTTYINGATVLNFLRVHFLVYDQDQYDFDGLYHFFESSSIYNSPAVISVNPGSPRTFIYQVMRFSFPTYEDSKCFFFFRGLDMSSSGNIEVQTRCTIDEVTRYANIEITVGSDTLVDMLLGSLFIVNLYETEIVNHFGISDQLITIEQGVPSAPFPSIDSTTTIFMLGLSSIFKTNGVSLNFDFENPIIYPSQGTNSLLIMTITQLQCNLGQELNRVTGLCEQRQPQKSIVTTGSNYRQSQFSHGMKYIAVSDQFSIQIYEYNEVSSSYIFSQSILLLSQVYSVRLSPNFDYIIASNSYSSSVMTRLPNSKGYSIIYQIQETTASTPNDKFNWISDDGQVFGVSALTSDVGVWKFKPGDNIYQQYLKGRGAGVKVKVSGDGKFFFINGQQGTYFSVLYDYYNNGSYNPVMKQPAPETFTSTKSGRTLILYHSSQPSSVFHWNDATNQFDLHHQFQSKYFTKSTVPIVSIADDGLTMIMTANHPSQKLAYIFSRPNNSSNFQPINTFVIGEGSACAHYDAMISSDGSMFIMVNDTQHVMIRSLSAAANIAMEEVIPDSNLFTYQQQNNSTDNSTLDDNSSLDNSTEELDQQTAQELEVGALATATGTSVAFNILCIVYIIYEKCKVPEIPEISKIYDSMNLPELPQQLNMENNISFEMGSSKKSDPEQKHPTEQILRQENEDNDENVISKCIPEV